jgi:hypothetical protein
MHNDLCISPFPRPFFLVHKHLKTSVDGMEKGGKSARLLEESTNSGSGSGKNALMIGAIGCVCGVAIGVGTSCLVVICFVLYS